MRKDEENEGGKESKEEAEQSLAACSVASLSSYKPLLKYLNMSTMSLGSGSNVFPGGLKLLCVCVCVVRISVCVGGCVGQNRVHLCSSWHVLQFNRSVFFLTC